MDDISPRFDSVPKNPSSRVEQVTTRSAVIAGRVLVAHDDQRVLLVDGRPIRFTPLEYRLVSLLLREPCVPASFTALAYAAFAQPADVATRRALDKHMDRIRSKLHPHELTVCYVREYGYVMLSMSGDRRDYNASCEIR